MAMYDRPKREGRASCQGALESERQTVTLVCRRICKGVVVPQHRFAPGVRPLYQRGT